MTHVAPHPSIHVWSPMVESSGSQAPPALVVTGMHRSGTSCTAAVLQAAGLSLGERLLGADPSNPHGHFEDLDFLDFHRQALQAHGLSEDGLIADAGVGDLSPRQRRRAAALVESRRSGGRPWGWKDPRTVLFLPSWRTLVPEARYLLVFRPPWEVVDSLFRRGDAVFCREPTFALKVWMNYNARLRDFARAHLDRVLVRELSQVVADPEALCAAVRERLGVPLDRPRASVHPESLGVPTPERAGFLAAASRACIDLWNDLRALAGLGAHEPPRCDSAASAVGLEEGMERWQRDCRPARAAEARRGERVFIAVPAFRGVTSIAETLRSIQAQEHGDYRVCISVDGDDTATADACRPFLVDPRFELHVQPRRLGWAGNLNWLMDRCTEDFFCFWQQDDLAATSFLKQLVAHALHYPDAACVFADVQWFGKRFDRVESPSLTGFALERVLQQIEHGYYVPFLGMVRADALARVGPVRITAFDSALEDQVWLAHVAGQGAFHRVPGTLYFKRSHAEATHVEWETMPDQTVRRRIWLEWGVGMLQAAMSVSPPQEHGKLCDIVCDRLTVPRNERWFFYDAGSHGVEELAMFRTEFLAIVRDRLGVVGAGDRILEGYARDAAEDGCVEISTAAGEPGLAMLGGGWSAGELEGVWSEGTEALLHLPVPPGGDWRVRLYAKPYPRGESRRDLAVRVRGEVVARKTYSIPKTEDDSVIEFEVRDGRWVVLEMPWAASPRNLGDGDDVRRLGVCLHRLELQRVDHDAAREQGDDPADCSALQCPAPPKCESPLELSARAAG